MSTVQCHYNKHNKTTKVASCYLRPCTTRWIQYATKLHTQKLLPIGEASIHELDTHAIEPSTYIVNFSKIIAGTGYTFQDSGLRYKYIWLQLFDTNDPRPVSLRLSCQATMPEPSGPPTPIDQQRSVILSLCSLSNCLVFVNSRMASSRL
jgi:hypothetical protein